MDVRKLIRKNILALEPYSTARDEFQGGAEISAWLDANESPYPNGGLNRYPDPRQRMLKARVAGMFGLGAESLFLGGAGSDEAIDVCFRVFCEPRVDNVVAIAPSYGVYKVAADINDVEYRAVQLDADFSLPVERLLAAADGRTKLMWICSPNNPTGNAFSREELLRLADGFHGMLVVDEAYADFSDSGSILGEIAAHPNLIVLRTFSKAWGLAGMRAGMAFASPEVITYFDRVKYPYNMSAPVQAELLRRLNRRPDAQVVELRSERLRLAEALGRSPGVLKVYPTDANFLLVKFEDADGMYRRLLDGGVIVRNRSRLAGCEGCLRITVGTPAENSRVLQIIERR